MVGQALVALARRLASANDTGAGMPPGSRPGAAVASSDEVLAVADLDERRRRRPVCDGHLAVERGRGAQPDA